MYYHNSDIYYTVAGSINGPATRFSTKTQAMDYHMLHPNQQIYFHWYEDAWKKSNVHINPTETYHQLLKERAQALRDSADYLRLYISGGSDSYTMLRAFLDNNIHIDEIVHAVYEDKNLFGSFDKSIINIETHRLIMPMLEYHKDKLSKTKFTKVAPTQEEIRTWHRNFDPDFYAWQEYYFIITASKQIYLHHTKNFKKGIVSVFGGAKPKFYATEDDLFMHQVDNGLNMHSYYPSMEDFFIDKNNPKLFIKTLHLFKDYVEKHNFTRSEINHTTEGENPKVFNHAIGRFPIFHDVGFDKSILLPTVLDPATGETSVIQTDHIDDYNLIKQLAYKNSEYQQLYDIYISNINNIKNKYKDYVDHYSITKSFVGVYTKFWSLSTGIGYDNYEIEPQGLRY